MGHINHVQLLLTESLRSMCWGKGYTVEVEREYFAILSSYLESNKDNLCKTRRLTVSKFSAFPLPFFLFVFNLTKEGQYLKELPGESALLMKYTVEVV